MIDKLTDKVPKDGESLLNFWRISVLGILLGIAMIVNHYERKEHNQQTHSLLMEMAKCETQ